MKLHYMGKFDGNEETLPHDEHRPGAVQFREPDAKKFTLIANIGSIFLLVPLLLLYYFRQGAPYYFIFLVRFAIGAVLALLSLFPHEVLHALCFHGDVYLYTWLNRGALFVAGAEDMSKGRFIFMSLLPNLVFGVLPFVAFLIFPKLVLLGAFGTIAIPCGFGDYLNVFYALTQMPNGARVYPYGFHSYWYLP